MSKDLATGREVDSAPYPTKELAFSAARELFRQKHELICIKGPSGEVIGPDQMGQSNNAERR
jgi:hypothetical protein